MDSTEMADRVCISAGDLNNVLLLAAALSPKGGDGQFEASLMIWRVCGRQKRDAEYLYHLACAVHGYAGVRLQRLLDEGVIVVQPAVATAEVAADL